MRTELVLALLVSVWTAAASKKKEEKDNRIRLHIGGIFPMTKKHGGWGGGEACLPAAQMAFDDINRRKDVIPGYKLVLHGDKNDSECQPGLAAKIMYELIYTKPTKVILLSGCSGETTLVAEAADVWSLLVMGYGSSSPALSQRDRFPTLFRTHPSATINNPARVKMFEKYKWNQIGVIYANAEVFVTTADDLEKKLNEAGKKLVTRQTFGVPADAVANLKRLDARIIVGLYYEQDARQVLCEAYKRNLYGPRYVWFLIGWYLNNWYVPQANDTLNCTAAEMRKAAAYHFTTEGLMESRSPKPGISKMTYDTFATELKKRLNKDDPIGKQEAPLAYDAIWAVALAFNCTIYQKRIQLETFQYKNKTVRNALLSCMQDVEFEGVSGVVKFSSVGDRITPTQIEQLQDGGYKIIGYYHQKENGNGNGSSVKGEIRWEPNTTVMFEGGIPPKDSKTVIIQKKLVSVNVYASMSFFAGVGIAVAIACTIFNYIFCYRKFIFLSQYQVNNLMLAGCIVCFVAVFIAGIPMEKSPSHTPSSFSALCHVRATMLMYGFTLMYGAMFSKVWIVHRMGSLDGRDQTVGRFGSRVGYPFLKKISVNSYTSTATLQNVRGGSVNGLSIVSRLTSTASAATTFPALEKAIPTWKFYAVVGVFAAVDTVIALTWVVVDAMQLKEKDLEDMQDRNDEKIDEKLEYCDSKHQQVWIGIIYTYKGLLLFFGLFLAYEIRNAKAKHVNDSRFVGMAIYNVAVLCLITGPVTLIIPSQPDANFGFIAATILLCTFLSMGLVFVPKMVHVVRVPSATETHKPSSAVSATVGSTIGEAAPLTKEEQDRLKKLLAENEDIKRQISEKDVRIMELRRRLDTRIAQHQQHIQGKKQSVASSIGAGTSVSGVDQQVVNGQLNKNLTLPVASASETVVVATKKSSIAPAQAGGSTPHKAVTFRTVPNEPQPPSPPPAYADDSGYRSSVNEGKPASDGFQIEPADTDVLL